MKKTVKTDNKLCFGFFAILLVCSILFTGTSVFVSAADISVPEETLLLASSEVSMELNGTASLADGILKLPAADDSANFKPHVKHETNYTLSFKMKNSKINSLLMEKTSNFFYFRDGDFTMETKAPYSYSYFMNDGLFSYFLIKDYNFGGKVNSNWADVSINFTTPWQNNSDYGRVNIRLKCAETDDNLQIKDLCLKEIGGTNNRLFNSGFESFDNSGEKRVPTNFNPMCNSTIDSNSVYQEILEDANGNHYLHVKKRDKEGSTYFYNSVNVPNALQAKPDYALPNSGKRYKLSLKYMVPSSVNKTLGPRFDISPKGNGLHTISHGHFPPASPGVWETYTAYIDGSRYLTKDTTWASNVFFGHQTFEYYMDDLFLGIDESEINFNKNLEFFLYGTDDAKTRYFNLNDSVSSSSNGTDNMFSTEKGIRVKTLAELEDTNNDGFLEVTPRVHYIPAMNANSKYDVHNITLVAAVYGTDANGNRILHSVKLASDKTTADGKTIDVKIDNVEVPAEGNYQVETMAINMDNMKPLVNKTILTNSGVVVEG